VNGSACLISAAVTLTVGATYTALPSNSILCQPVTGSAEAARIENA